MVTYGLFGDYVLGGAVVQMSAHWFLRLRLEVDGLEVLRHICIWAVMGWKVKIKRLICLRDHEEEYWLNEMRYTRG